MDVVRRDIESQLVCIVGYNRSAAHHDLSMYCAVSHGAMYRVEPFYQLHIVLYIITRSGQKAHTLGAHTHRASPVVSMRTGCMSVKSYRHRLTTVYVQQYVPFAARLLGIAHALHLLGLSLIHI